MIHHNMFAMLLCATAVLALGSVTCHAQSTLGRIRSEVSQPDSFIESPEQEQPEKSDKKKKKRSRDDKTTGLVSFFDDDCDCDCDDDEDDGDGLVKFAFTVAATTVTSPFWGPHVMLETDQAELLGPLCFSRSPYMNGSVGAMRIFDFDQTSQKNWQLRSSFEFLDTEGAEISALGGRFSLDSLARFGVETSFNNWREKIPTASIDSTWVGDVNLLYRFAQSQSTQFRAGIGVNWLSDATTSAAGYNLTYGIDLFPFQPLHLAGEIDWGQLGHTHLLHARVTSGLLWRNFEIYTGYDYLSIGQPEFHSLIIGTGLWF